MMVIYSYGFNNVNGSFALTIDGKPINLTEGNTENCMLFDNGEAAILIMPATVNHVDIEIYGR